MSQGPLLANANDEYQGNVADGYSNSTVGNTTPMSLRVPVAVSSIQAQIPVGELSPSDMSSPPTAQPPTFTSPLVIASERILNDDEPIVSWTPAHGGDDSTYMVTPPLIHESLLQQGSTGTHSALLRFRYQVLPWMDSNNCKSTFGPKITTLARGNKVISDCIAYCMWVRDRISGGSGIILDDSSSPQILLEQLSREDALIADVGRALLTISDVFCKPPSEWANIPDRFGRCGNEQVPRSRTFGSTPEPLKTCLRLHLKIGKDP